MKTPCSRRAFLAASGAGGLASLTGCATLGFDTAEPGAAAVVSQHSLATAVGIDLLEAGGTAADAAVGVACALSVVEPWFSSVLGGGTWALYYEADNETVTSLDGVGPVGSKATADDYRSRANSAGTHQAIVPGAFDGWMQWLDRYGVLDVTAVLTPAIELARDGYPVSDEMARWLRIYASEIADRPAAAAIYMPDGDLLSAGDTVFQHDMADTFASIAAAADDAREAGRSAAIDAARDYFYRGPIADAIVAFSDEHDGYLTQSDFHEFSASIVEPLSIAYDNEIRVLQNPPNSQGITQLLALNILKGFDLASMEPADAIHLQVEALKLAFADRHAHVGDPERVEIPVTELLDDAYATAQRDRIEMDRAQSWPIDSGIAESRASAVDAGHTTTFHIVDSAGNAAAVTTSLGAEFLVAGDTGVHLNNRMRMVALDDDDPNRLTPGYKVRHTSNPYMALRNGRPFILGGNTGVDTQPQGQTQQFLHAVAFGRDAQTAVDQPRFVSTAFPSTQYPYRVTNRLQVESDFDDSVVDELANRGHDIQRGRGVFGSANMLVVEADRSDIQVGAESRISTADGRTRDPPGE